MQFLRRLLAPALVALALVALAVPTAPSALAHAELRQSSPAAGETVGGEIHGILLQFFDLDVVPPQTVNVFDAAGNEIVGSVSREDQRLAFAPIDPIATPGEYIVTYAVVGVDGDFSEGSFTFTWEAGAPAPSGITVDLGQDGGFDLISFVFLLIGAGLLAFLVQRFMFAYKEHRAAQTASAASP